MKATDGKFRETDVLYTEGIFRLIESVPSPKVQNQLIIDILTKYVYIYFIRGLIMKYIIKRSINLFGKNNIIKFCYNVKINNNGNGFENFDIGNEEIIINDLLKPLNQDTINRLNEINLIYISLSKYFFDNNKKLSAIEYENDVAISRITREDLH